MPKTTKKPKSKIAQVAKKKPGTRANIFPAKFQGKLKKGSFAKKQLDRTEILLPDDNGFIEPDEGENTSEYNQKEIADNVDITGASKHFSLSLELGPYRLDYTKNGRHLMLGGKKGHIAAFDWITKKLRTEFNVMEEIVAISWLHVETMMAVAQKNWVYIYDNQGTELHCVKALNRVNQMEFLPYHFLLASINEKSYLSWLDVSIGEIMASYPSKLGRVSSMVQNPTNAIIYTGDSKGVVSMWAPSVPAAMTKVLCHSVGITSIAVDPKGTRFATGGIDKKVKLWDTRMLETPITTYNLRTIPNTLEISQRSLLAIGMGNVVEVYRPPGFMVADGPYLRHRCQNYVNQMQFCPFEDVLGVCAGQKFDSLLVPGAGEPNYDTAECNPFETKRQRQEFEVRRLLEKIPMELISTEKNNINKIKTATLKDAMDAKLQLAQMKHQKHDVKIRNKMKGKGGSANTFKRKHIVKETSKREFISQMKNVKTTVFGKPAEGSNDSKSDSVLTRFKTKKNKA